MSISWFAVSSCHNVLDCSSVAHVCIMTYKLFVCRDKISVQRVGGAGTQWKQRDHIVYRQPWRHHWCTTQARLIPGLP